MWFVLAAVTARIGRLGGSTCCQRLREGVRLSVDWRKDGSVQSGGGACGAGGGVGGATLHGGEAGRVGAGCRGLDALFIVLLCQYRLGDLGKVSMGRV